MKRIVTLAIIFLAIQGSATGQEQVAAKLITTIPTAPQHPGNGPSDPFIYSNDDGTFVIGPLKNGGVAKYTWQGAFNKDVLTFLGYVELTDSTGNGVPQGQTYTAWLYDATDSLGNTWFLAFGVDPLQLQFPLSSPRYGLFWSHDNPTVPGPGGAQIFMRRWLTRSGTTRK
jgi:hypothetical protein